MINKEMVEAVKMLYPPNTRVRLHSMEGETAVPPGTEGIVQLVDDIGQIHVAWENGSTLALNVEVDSFEKVNPEEGLGDKLYKEYCKKIDPIISSIDFRKLNMSCNSEDTSYAADILLRLHKAFEEVYGQGYVDEKYGIVVMPAVVRGRESEITTLAFVVLDLESSGEHWGTTFFTPGGLLIQGNPELTEEQKRAIKEYYIPYNYWYTPMVERDHHVDFESMPEQVINIRKKVDELLLERAETAAMEAMEGGQKFIE